MQKSGHMVLKAVNLVHIDKIRLNGLERSQLGTQCKNPCHMVLKGVNWVHNDKINSNGLERSQFGTQCKKKQNRSNCLERSELGTICKTIIYKVS